MTDDQGAPVLEIHGLKIEMDRDMLDDKYARRNDGEDTIFVSPSMYSLLESDLDLMRKSLRVRVLKPMPF